MEPFVSYLIVGLLGGAIGVLFPYVFKVWQDPEIVFDYAYFWSLATSMAVAITVFIPKGVAFDIVTAIGVFFACVGVTVPLNKGVNLIRKAEAENK